MGDKSHIHYNTPYLFSNDAPTEEEDIPFEQDCDAEDKFDEDTTNTFDSDEFEPEVAEDDKTTRKELSRVSKKQAKTLSTMWQKAVNAKQVH